MKKVFITGKIPVIAYKLLAEEGYEVTVFDSDEPIRKSELIHLAKDSDAVISLLTDKLDASVIEKLKSCKVIANYAVGFNNIDIKSATDYGIKVTNTPDILTDATADLTLALILAVARRVVEGDNLVRDGMFTGWKPELLLGVELRGKTLGIVGAGRIGQAVAMRAKAFGLKIIYYSRSPKTGLERKTGAGKVGIKTLMRRSDIVTLHAPLTPKTFNLVNKDLLKLLKPNAIFINTARGEIVDEKYLISMLKKKQILGAGFDVYQNEPKINKQLSNLENVLLLPHLGSATVETRDAMAELAANNVIKVLKGQKPVTPVN